jgi:hypothetical protein
MAIKQSAVKNLKVGFGGEENAWLGIRDDPCFKEKK